MAMNRKVKWILWVLVTLCVLVLVEEAIRSPEFTFASNDRISVHHVANTLKQRWITAFRTGVQLHSICLTVPALRRSEAVATIREDRAWPEIRSRLNAWPTALESRLDSAEVRLLNVSVPEALASLQREGSPVEWVLRDATVLSEGSTAVVESLTEIDRNFMDSDGQWRHGCEVKVVLGKRAGKWRRIWYGQVFFDDGGWHIEESSSSGNM